METKHDIKATLKKTGKQITVYKHREGGYVDSNDMTTKYTTKEIKIN